VTCAKRCPAKTASDSRISDRAGDVHAEKCATNDLSGEVGHGIVNVDRFAVAPARRQPGRGLAHDRGVLLDAGAREGRLYVPPPFQPRGVLAGDQPVAEHAAGDLPVRNPESLAVAEDRLDMIDGRYRHESAASEAKGRDVPLLPGQAGQETEEVTSELP
jgi:hypothetical protein